jgi:hydroxyethylthiazole kinase
MPDSLDNPLTVSRAAAALLGRLRARRPAVLALTSPVAQAFTANLLLAAGAQPSLSQAGGEVEAFAERTDALLVNLGMLDLPRREAAEAALPVVERRGVPWLLDPVKAERSPDRAAFAQRLLAFGPAAVHANAEEAPLVAAWPGTTDCVLALTGPVDEVRRGDRSLRIANGHPLMAAVTAVGCAGMSLAAAFLAVEDDPWLAVAAALLALGVGGELAGEAARGPGSFQPALLDALYSLDEETLCRRSRIST